MNSKDKSIRELAKRLGPDYRVTIIDFEPVVYRDFGNGFNVEISGMYTTNKKAKANLYLWNGEKYGARVVKTAMGVAREDIEMEVVKMHEYSKSLIEEGNKNKEEKE